MKVLITGGTGFIGSVVTKKLIERGDKVLLLTRDEKRARKRFTLPGISVFEYDFKPDSLIPVETLDDIDAIINMAGEPIFTGRWTYEKKKLISESRINTTKQIVDSISMMEGKKPEVLINASAVGYYGFSDDTKLTEDSPNGKDYLAQVCGQWEAEALKASSLGVRVVVLRTGIVLDKDGGALKKMLLPFKFYLGGPIGSGKQYFSWIHIEDMSDLYIQALDDSDLRGPVNATAPSPVTMRQLSSIIGKRLKKPSWFPIPAFIAKMVIGESAQVVVNGQRVIPKKLLTTGFPFKYIEIASAIKSILG